MITTKADPSAVFLQAVNDALAKQVEGAKEQVIKQAVQEFEEKVRTAVGNVAIRVAEYYTVQMLGSQLIITVKLEKP